MLGSVTREAIQATKYFFFWLGYGWMITFPKNLTNDNATIISPLLSGTHPKTANFFFKKIKWASILMYRRFPSPPFMATPILLQAVLDQFRQLFLTAQMNKNSTKERLIKRAVVCPGLLVKTWERRRLNVSSMHGWMDMDIFTCRTSFSYRRTTHASHILPLRLSRKEDFGDSFKEIWIRITRLEFTNHEAMARLLHSGHWDTLVEERSFGEKKKRKNTQVCVSPIISSAITICSWILATLFFPKIKVRIKPCQAR